MYLPDRVIVRKVKEYDPYLYIEWNSKKQFFELWRKTFHGPKLVTPITQSIYDTKKPIQFAPLDDRLLWWIWAADGWRQGRRAILEEDARWQELQQKMDRDRLRAFRDFGKDAWHSVSNFYCNRPDKKNGSPKFNHYRPDGRWIAPDVQKRTSSRLLCRSRENALAYNFKK